MDFIQYIAPDKRLLIPHITVTRQGQVYLSRKLVELFRSTVHFNGADIFFNEENRVFAIVPREKDFTMKFSSVGKKHGILATRGASKRFGIAKGSYELLDETEIQGEKAFLFKV